MNEENLAELTEPEIAEVPTLHSVVHSGDESIIKTTRLGHEIEQELASMPDESYYLTAGLSDGPEIEEALELLIDDVVDRHIISLRRDFRVLLEQVLAGR